MAEGRVEGGGTEIFRRKRRIEVSFRIPGLGAHGTPRVVDSALIGTARVVCVSLIVIKRSNRGHCRRIPKAVRDIKSLTGAKERMDGGCAKMRNSISDFKQLLPAKQHSSDH